MLKYSITLKWSDEDGGFIAIVPELSGLSAFGETQEEAVAELQVAAEAYLESLREAEETIPAPEKIVPFSGQIRVRMPRSLHARLSQASENEGVSLNTYIVSLLSEGRAQKQNSDLYSKLLGELQGQRSAILSIMSETLSLSGPAEKEIDSRNSGSLSYKAWGSN